MKHSPKLMQYLKTFKNFEHWHALDVSQKLGIERGKPTETFRKWTDVTPEIAPFWQPFIKVMQDDLILFHDSWNETELLGRFIIPFLSTVQWFGKYFNLFNERPLRATVKDYPVSGIVDGMVAMGSYEPYRPYFFLQEYKRLKKGESDPLGQVLIAMLAARELNQRPDPVYGCYVISKYWSFLVLEGSSTACRRDTTLRMKWKSKSCGQSSTKRKNISKYKPPRTGKNFKKNKLGRVTA